ncbi:hypothetical protein [Nocardia sp. NPDC050710]|uniref:hypothetical protein n=1 Tax=Nocardia sp. NPDC050710 TaxID=3157220 RepID=UPI0033C5EB32
MITRRILLALLLIALGVLVGGCGNSIRGIAIPAPLGVAETADPLAVLRDGFVTMFGWRPGTDRSPDDAYLRARPYLTEQLAAGDPDSGGSKAQWKSWAEAKAKVSVTVQIATDEHPPDQSTRIDRVVLIKQTITDAAAKPLDSVELTVWATVVQTEQGWRIQALRF